MKAELLTVLTILGLLGAIVCACAYFSGPPPTGPEVEQQFWDMGLKAKR